MRFSINLSLVSNAVSKNYVKHNQNYVTAGKDGKSNFALQLNFYKEQVFNCGGVYGSVVIGLLKRR